MQQRVGVGGVVAALSVTSDLTRGHPPGEAMRACLVATELARRAGLDHIRRGEVYYGTLHPYHTGRILARSPVLAPLGAGVPGARGHHVQLVRALPVLVPEVEQPAGHPGVEAVVAQPGQRVPAAATASRLAAAAIRSMTGLAASPGTEVLPMCSTASNTPSEIRSARAAAARTGQASSYSTTSITERASILPRLRRTRPGR